MPDIITAPFPESSVPAPSMPAPSQPAGVEVPFNDAFADLDKLGIDTPDAKEETAPEKPPVTDKSTKPPEDKVSKPVKLPEKKQLEPADKKLAEVPDKKPAEADAKTGKRSPWQVVHDKEAEIATLRKELSERDKSKPNGQWEKERADLLKRIEDRDKQLQEKDEKLQYSAFEESDKFKSEYDKPYTNAWNLGRAAVARFKVTDAEGNQRPAKPEDFDNLMALEQQDPERAADLLAEMFGNKAAYVASHIVEVKKAYQRIQDARGEFRTRGDEDRKLKSAQTEKETQELAETFSQVRNTAAEKYPDLFAAPEEDAPGKEVLGKGEHFANRVFSSGQPLAEGDKPLTKAQKSALDAVAWQKLRAFDYQVSRRQKAETRIKELEAELEQYKKSEPGPGDGGGHKPVDGDVPDWEKQLGDMATTV